MEVINARTATSFRFSSSSAGEETGGQIEMDILDTALLFLCPNAMSMMLSVVMTATLLDVCSTLCKHCPSISSGGGAGRSMLGVERVQVGRFD